ncbi:hypothetical protein ACLB2K_039392 [Fragaria x ananassa]
MTPFQALYGYEPPAVRTYVPGSTAVDSVDQQLKSRDELLALLKRNLIVAQARMKMQYDRKHVERSFEVGDWVYLKLQPYKQQSVARRKCHKLSPRYYGPFQVEEKNGTVAYKLTLPAAAKILWPYVDPHNPRWYLGKILARRMFKKGNSTVIKWLIQWLGAIEEEATWEEANDIIARFPDFPTTTTSA